MPLVLPTPAMAVAVLAAVVPTPAMASVLASSFVVDCLAAVRDVARFSVACRSDASNGCSQVRAHASNDCSQVIGR
jgi:hypothetical protein